MELKAIAFDLDGTLYPQYRILLPSLLIALRYPRFIYYFNRVRNEIRKIKNIDDFKRSQAELMAKFLGKDAFNTQKAIDRIIYGKWLDTIKTMKPYTGIRELIISLRKCGFKTALLSDLPVERKLSYLGLEGIWDVAFSSEETNYLKPNLVPFQRLITMLGEKPENIIYIGDNYKYDVLGARLAGMKTIYFSNKSKNKNLADFHFKHYSDLKKYLTSLTEIKKNHGSCL